MSRDNLLFLAGGMLFGALVGYFVADAVGGRSVAPSPHVHAPAPAGASASEAGRATAHQMDAADVQAIEGLQSILARDPRNAPALVKLANLFHDAEMWTQAIAHYERAIEEVPADPDVLTDLGICYRGNRQFELALESFAKAHKADPRHWKALFNTAIVAGFDLGRLDEADLAISKLEQVNPSAPNLEQMKQDLARVRASKRSAS